MDPSHPRFKIVVGALRARLPRPDRRWLVGAVVLLAVGAIGAAFLRANHAKDLADPARARAQGRPIPVRTATVEKKTVEQVVGATGITLPSQIVSVRIGPSRGLSAGSPESELAVKKVHVRDGAAVKTDQILFELEDDIFRRIVDRREGALAVLEAEAERIRQAVALNGVLCKIDVLSAEAEQKYRAEDLANREAALDLIGRLYRDKGAANAMEFFDAKSKAAEARYRHSEAERRLERARAGVVANWPVLELMRFSDQRDLAKVTTDIAVARVDVEMAKHDLDRCRIRSPLDGYVTRVDLVPGAVIGVNNVLTQIVKLDPIHVQMDFPQERIDEVALGQKAEVVLDSFPKDVFNGTVVSVLPQVKPELRVLPVIVAVPNPDGRIKAGISGFVRIRQSRTVVVAPALGVLERANKAVVFRVENGRARIREVASGRLADSGLVEVRDGLAPGDEVVVFHSNFYRHGGALTKTECFLQDNDPVDTDWRRWTRRED